jgi:hypothetical protein
MIENGDCDTRLRCSACAQVDDRYRALARALDRLQHTRYLRFFTPTV